MAENGSGRSIHVTVGEGPPSTPCGTGTNKGVDGGPAAAMTCNGRCLHCIFMVEKQYCASCEALLMPGTMGKLAALTQRLFPGLQPWHAAATAHVFVVLRCSPC